MGETGGIYRDQALDGDMGRDTEREIRDIVGGGLLKEACVRTLRGARSQRNNVPLDGNSPLRPSRLSTLTPLSHICLDCAHCQGSPSAPTSARLLGPAPPASSSKFSLLSATLQNLTAWEPWDPPFSKEATKPVVKPQVHLGGSEPWSLGFSFLQWSDI